MRGADNIANQNKKSMLKSAKSQTFNALTTKRIDCFEVKKKFKRFFFCFLREF